MGRSNIDREPRPEDFGLTEEDLARAPEPVTSRCRPLLLGVLWLIVVVAVFALILQATGSASAALLFSVVAVGAASIVLVPLLVCVVCASERAETRWLCRHVPVFEACLAYRAAVDAHRRRRRRAGAAAADHGRWLELSPQAFRVETARELGEAGFAVIAPADREAAGYDFTVEDEQGARSLVRCEPSHRPVPIGVGRELVACLAETGVDRAVVVAAAPPSARLETYLEGRPLEVVAPWALIGQQPAAD